MAYGSECSVEVQHPQVRAATEHTSEGASSLLQATATNI